MPAALRQLGFNILLSAAEAGPKWQKVFPLGETRHRDDFGSLTFDRAFLESMVKNYAAEGKPSRPWDYFHRGSSDDSAVRNEDKVAAGWFRDVELREDGLYVLTEWTAKAKAAIDAKELQYPSPTFSENAVDPKTGQPCGPKLFAVALLNDPFLTDLPAVQASANPVAPKGTPMKLVNTIAALKLSENAVEADIESAVKAKLEELEAAKSEVTKLKAQAEKSGGDVTKLQERIKSLEDAAIERELNEGTTALCVKLEGEGRITAAEKADIAEDVKAFGLKKATERWSKRPVVVDLKERGTNREGPANGMPPVEAHKQLELKAAEIAKANPVDAPRAYLLAAQANPELAKAAQKVVPEDRRS